MHNTPKRTTTPGSLYRLIYRSRAAIDQPVSGASGDGGVQQTVGAILATARSRNKADNVTGALFYTNAGFVQVLEGSRDAVERTFERIAADPRHTDVTVLSFTPAHRRSFPDWPLGFCGHMPDGAAAPPDAAAGAAASDVRGATGSETLRFLERLIQQEDAWIGEDGLAGVSRVPGSQAHGR